MVENLAFSDQSIGLTEVEKSNSLILGLIFLFLLCNKNAMLPDKTKYTTKALMSLAKSYDSKELMCMADIAENENIPKKFLEAILPELRKTGVVIRKMCTHGGYLYYSVFQMLALP